jgi:thioredoxin reductase
MTDVAIIGAGPYGLSTAAHFRRKGISFRIFGRPMDSWLLHMPKGMVLKSDGFASNIYDPDGEFTLERFCADRGIAYSDSTPVGLETFAAYGLAFKERMVPELEEKQVVGLDRSSNGFLLRLDNGEIAKAKHVVLAIGITHFQYMPDNLAHLPPELVSHSFRHHDLEAFRARSVVVIGGGASALDLAGLLHESGAEVQMVARRTSLKFHSMPTGKPRSQWQQIRHPKSGLGPGLRSRFYANAPGLFYYLPENLRLHIVRTSLGPSGGWFIKEKVVGRVPLLLNCTLLDAKAQGDKVCLRLRTGDGTEREIVTQHVIAATGYKVDLERLPFLSPEIRSKVKAISGSPVLSSKFESSVPGLYFVGVAATNSFGPVMRFAFGAGFAARSLTRTIAKARSMDPAFVPAPRTMSAAK